MRVRRTTEIGCVVAFMSLAACQAGGEGAPAELSGVEGVVPLTTAESEAVEALDGDVGLLGVVDDVRVDVAYMGGPVCRPDYHSQEPGEVSAAYEEDRIVITIDPTTRDCGDADAAEFGTAVEVELSEPIEDRPIELRSAP